ncbi:nifR3 family TIM-barrel protein [Phytomonospora endophytica]|uniref:NifR3 family TIM-barrel protein n=2 Tax=Phytomonospora endophytica TaxID=714109 RepID=A0A841FEC5_9ACTN|nr:tRNA dihydrouridine synthase DusB [Phytomonospora endophytica]MBB6034184.1 nifR3 family TIM-barrel protein [Phytomonospora endophytica]GIG66576.1 tRNA-dihydrouridine synthase [Phytomonospora endophytica]
MIAPLTLGKYTVDPPVVLAPMAGITNVAFRQLCAEQGAGIYTCEMVMTRALIERNPKTTRMVAFGPNESPRSLQLYGVDPVTVRKAVEMIVDEDLADHIDMNFGCPVPRVTKKGGGSAIPYKRRLFEQIVRAAVGAAGDIPVTVKMRKGIDDDLLTYLDAGRIAQDAGVAWVALHARTAAQRYSGEADWTAIAALKQHLDVPVLGNGDIWEATDALRMVDETGCDGVVVGRGCLGRPWLFADLAAAFKARAEGREPRDDERVLPHLDEVARIMRRHAELLVAWYTDAGEPADEGTTLRPEKRRRIGAEEHGCTDFRKHVAWYLKGFSVGSDTRRALAMISSLTELDDLLGGLDTDQPFPTSILGQSRGRTNSPARVQLPEGWLDDPDDDTVPSGADLEHSGG